MTKNEGDHHNRNYMRNTSCTLLDEQGEEMKQLIFKSVMIGLTVGAISFVHIKYFDNQLETKQQEVIARIEDCRYVPTPTVTPTCTPTPTSTPTPTPIPTPICEISNQQFYDECVARGMITPAHDEDDRITKERGGYMGESGRETYYNLKMDLCVYYMRELGYDEIEYPYWIRNDGAKMLGNYVMCAANWSIRPKGTIIPTSLGDAIVVDTGEFVIDYPYGVDLAVDW